MQTRLIRIDIRKEPPMNINGIQKLTLLDYPGRTACTVFLAGCDLRCPFCHNSELISANAPAVMDENGLYGFLETRKGILDGVAFTGGEPLLRPELPKIMKKIHEMGFLVKLDTNGTHPERLSAVLERGLADYVAMDVKNSPEKYAQTAGVEKIDIGKIDESISILVNGGIDHEFRTTVVGQLHDETSFGQIGPWIKGAKRYFLQAFADRETVVYAGFTAPSKEKMQVYADIVRPYVNETALRGV